MKFGKLTPLVGSFLFRNQVTIMAGGPYAGKSRFSLNFAQQLSSGSTTPFGQYPPFKVLYCSERDWDFNSEQLRTIGLGELPENMRFFCGPDIPDPDVPTFEANPLFYIDKWLHANDKWNPDLIIMDTVPHFQTSRVNGGEQTNSYSFNRKELLRLKRWATQHHAAILALFHSPKQNEKTKYEDPFDRILGSVAILASSVAACILERIQMVKDGEEYLQIHFRSHVSKMQTPRVFDYNKFAEQSAPLIDAALSPMEELVLSKIPADPVHHHILVSNLAADLNKQPNQIRNLLITLRSKYKIIIVENPVDKRKVVKKIIPS